MRHRVDLRCLSHRLIRGQPALRVNQVRGEDSVDECRLSQASLTCKQHERNVRLVRGRATDASEQRMRTDDDHVELETALQELVLDLAGDAVESDIRARANFLSSGRGDWGG